VSGKPFVTVRIINRVCKYWNTHVHKIDSSSLFTLQSLLSPTALSNWHQTSPLFLITSMANRLLRSLKYMVLGAPSMIK